MLIVVHSAIVKHIFVLLFEFIDMRYNNDNEQRVVLQTVINYMKVFSYYINYSKHYDGIDSDCNDYKVVLDNSVMSGYEELDGEKGKKQDGGKKNYGRSNMLGIKPVGPGGIKMPEKKSNRDLAQVPGKERNKKGAKSGVNGGSKTSKLIKVFKPFANNFKELMYRIKSKRTIMANKDIEEQAYVYILQACDGLDTL